MLCGNRAKYSNILRLLLGEKEQIRKANDKSFGLFGRNKNWLSTDFCPKNSGFQIDQGAYVGWLYIMLPHGGKAHDNVCLVQKKYPRIRKIAATDKCAYIVTSGI